MVHGKQRRALALLSLVVLALALLALSALPALALAPVGQSPGYPNTSTAFYQQTGVGANVGPMGDSRTGVIGRTRLPEASPSFTSTTLVVSGLLAVVLIGIAGATALVDRRMRREGAFDNLVEPGAVARVPVRQTAESQRKAA